MARWRFLSRGVLNTNTVEDRWQYENCSAGCMLVTDNNPNISYGDTPFPA